jgi:DNA-binding NarL/FixJ family response regulator
VKASWQFIEGEVDLSEINSSILIASNWHQRRQSLFLILNSIAKNCTITAADFVHTQMILKEKQADVVVVDRWSPGDDITEFVKTIKETYPATRILVLDCFAQHNLSFILYPADAVLESDIPSNKIVDAVYQLLSSMEDGGYETRLTEKRTTLSGANFVDRKGEINGTAVSHI